MSSSSRASSTSSSSRSSSVLSGKDEAILKYYTICMYTLDKRISDNILPTNDLTDMVTMSALNRYKGKTIEVVKRKMARHLYKKIQSELLGGRANNQDLKYEDIVRRRDNRLENTFMKFYFFIKHIKNPFIIRKFEASCVIVKNMDSLGRRLNSFSPSDYTLNIKCVEDTEFKKKRQAYKTKNFVVNLHNKELENMKQASSLIRSHNRNIMYNDEGIKDLASQSNYEKTKKSRKSINKRRRSRSRSMTRRPTLDVNRVRSRLNSKRTPVP